MEDTAHFIMPPPMPLVQASIRTAAQAAGEKSSMTGGVEGGGLGRFATGEGLCSSRVVFCFYLLLLCLVKFSDTFVFVRFCVSCKAQAAILAIWKVS